MLAVFLKQCRLSAGLQQMDVAKALGYKTSQFVSNWERGISVPPIKTIHKLGVIYKASPEDLFKATLESKIIKLEQQMKKSFAALNPA